MRVLLSSDWRLGRAFHGADLLAEQSALLDQVVAAAHERRVGAVLLAGGLLDAGASREARDLLEHAFCRLVLDEKIPVVALVDGEAAPPGTGVLSRVGLHLLGSGEDPARPIELQDADGSWLLHALPTPGTPEDLVDALARAKTACRKGVRSLLLGRLPASTDFALPPAKAWRDFSAACLGGRRRPEELVSGRAWMAGAPLPWDFDDAVGERSASLIEIDAKGKARREEIPLRPARAVRRLAGAAVELLREGPSSDRLRLVVTDPGPVPELAELLARFPGVLEIDRPAPAATDAMQRAGALLADYYREVEGAPLPEAARALLNEALA